MPEAITDKLNSKELYRIFEKYCQFGSRTNVSPTSKSLSMDSSKFAKLIREADLLDSAITLIEVDIVFNRVKTVSERKISFIQFKDALKILGEKKFGPGNHQQFVDAIFKLKGPLISEGTTVSPFFSIIDPSCPRSPN